VNSPSPDFTDLHAWVTDEVAALADRLVNGRSATTARRLDEARKALAAAASLVESALTEPAVADDDLQLFKEQLSSHAGLNAIRAQLKELTERNEENLRLRAELTSAQAERDAFRADLSAERERVAETRAEIARITEEFDATLDELRHEHATVVGEQALAYSSLPLDALLSMFNALRRSTTLADVLTTLVDGIAREFSRVALFDVHGSHLEGARQVGFHFEHDISKVVIPLSSDSFLGRAVTSGRIETFFPGLHSGSGAAIPFGGTPACALAIPIVVQGTTVAVVYADDSDNPEFATSAPQMRAKFAELLQQHALLVLLRVGVHQTVIAELREFASLLVDELEYAHMGDLNAGKNPLERQQGLRDSLERSRRIYAQRAARDGHAATALLEEHLWKVIEGRGESPFSGDLAAVLGSMGAAPRASVLTMRR